MCKYSQGFGVWGLGFGVWGLGFGVLGFWGFGEVTLSMINSCGYGYLMAKISTEVNVLVV